jgi:hypothetical protein
MKSNIIFLLLLLLVSCKKDVEKYQPKFIVEGSIEQDGYAFVTLTHNLPFYAPIDSAQLDKVVIRYAKVTVSNGAETEVLTGYYDKNTFPYFYYKGSSLRGEAGKKYHLEISYAGLNFSADTEIPNPVSLDSLWFEPKPENKAQLCLKFTDNPNQKNYYKLYTKGIGQVNYIRTLLSNQDDKYFNGKQITLQVNRGAANNTTNKWDPYFNLGDSVSVKFATIPKVGFDFWSAHQNEIVNASNPLMSSTTALPGNIVGQATGIWCGYGTVYYSALANPRN